MPRRRDRVRALNQLHALIATAPEELRAELRGLTISKLVHKTAGLRPNQRTDVIDANKLAMRSLARRVRAIEVEVAEIDEVLNPLVAETAPDLVAMYGVGPDTAGALVVAAGDNPDRLRNEAAFAHLCGVSPLDASSGKQLRHRLNRSGDRQANAALWRIVVTRIGVGPENAALRRAPVQGGAHQSRGDALPEALRRPRSLLLPRPSQGSLTTLGASFGDS